MRTFFGIDRSELDRKRLWLEGVVIGIAAAVFATGLIMLVTRLVECLKIRTPHFEWRYGIATIVLAVMGTMSATCWNGQ